MNEDSPMQRPDYFVLEYSPSQRAWHIQHIEDLIDTNLLSYINQSANRDYMVMGVASTREELQQLQREIEKSFRKIHPDTIHSAETKSRKPTWFDRILRRFKP
jgi:chlorite dismutase